MRDVQFVVLLPILLAALLAGCAATGSHVADLPLPTVRTSLDAAGIKDARADFHRVFCRNYTELAASDGISCDSWLSVPAQANAPQRTAARPDARSVTRVVVIPGILGECVSKWVTPYWADYDYLRDKGYGVDVLDVAGRGSSDLNADLIHRFLEAYAFDRAVVIGYSKGVTDFMRAASQPRAIAWSGKIAAFVSVAGVVNGTPVAERSEDLYRQILARLPWPTCGASDGGGVASLTYRQAFDTAQAFSRVRKPYPSYSIAAIVDEGPVNPMLSIFHKLLNTVDSRNDGQVLLEDAIVPGSTFLGAMRADHWSIALPFEDSNAAVMRPFSVKNHFPRRALLAAVLETVERDISGDN